MKRICGDIINQVASITNIEAAVNESLKHRSKHNALTKDAALFLSNREANVKEIREALLSGDIGSIHYNTFYKQEHGKVRCIDWNPSFRHSVIQHALFRVVGERIVDKFIPDTYSGIKGRGPSYGLNRLIKHIKSFDGRPLYVLKFDIYHYYPSIVNELAKQSIRSVLKDKKVIRIFDTIIDSHPNGLPIGNYISQLIANLYLMRFDHWLIRTFNVKVLRYCDDIVILSDSKKTLWDVLSKSKVFLKQLGLSIKNDYQIFPIERGGIDFMGFVVTRKEIFLRKRIERSFRKSAKRFLTTPSVESYCSIASYNGWIKTLSKGNKLWNKIIGKSIEDCFACIKEAQ